MAVIGFCDMVSIIRPGVEAMAEWAEFARNNPNDPKVVQIRAAEAARQEAYRKRIAYLDWCVASGTSPVRGGENA
jgi:hypothetical protein